MNKSALHTSVCDMFGIEYPVFSAGMGGTVSPAGPGRRSTTINRWSSHRNPRARNIKLVVGYWQLVIGH